MGWPGYRRASLWEWRMWEWANSRGVRGGGVVERHLQEEVDYLVNDVSSDLLV